MCFRRGRPWHLQWQLPQTSHSIPIRYFMSLSFPSMSVLRDLSSDCHANFLVFLTLKWFAEFKLSWRDMFQLLSKGIVFSSGSQTGSPSTEHQLSITIDSSLAQKLAPTARIVVWYITELGEIVSDSLDFAVNGAFANEVMNCILRALGGWCEIYTVSQKSSHL